MSTRLGDAASGQPGWYNQNDVDASGINLEAIDVPRAAINSEHAVSTFCRMMMHNAIGRSAARTISCTDRQPAPKRWCSWRCFSRFLPPGTHSICQARF
jgi:hypothetical protein